MRVNEYSIATDATYFDLKFASVKTEVSNASQNLSNNSSSDLKIVEIDKQQSNRISDRLSKELSNAILKNVNAESRKVSGDRVEISTAYSEAQALNFSVSAFIKAEGKEMELSLNVNLSRSFTQQASLRIESLQALRDPLVINLDGLMPSLSSKTFSFDIDSDGESEQISQLKAGNGFLALDKNSNGKIDDGSELFGTKSGNGFKDLSIYDDDKNGWIDENDAIFDKLRVWRKTETQDKLVALGELGIGAIFLGESETPFSLKTDKNELLGEIKKSGFVVYENGKAGIISQIDFAVKPEVKETLNIVDKLEKNLKHLKIENIYKPEKKEEHNNQDAIGKILSKIRALESKLARANDLQKPSIQAQIGALFGKLLTLLETL
jgi:hypothetical protein